jgi:S-adenosyl-L-methionine hydrolase (adenosine-forming)
VTPFVSFLSDFGALATAPAVCRGVIWGICPDARILDLTHEVTRFSIREGAFLLWSAVPYLPVGVQLAVVDPGVGTARRGIALRTQRGDLMVGPDNGLLVPAAGRLGGIVAVHVLENRAFWLPDTTATFHGRDVFAPVAAHLAAGTPLAAVGPDLPVGQIVPLNLPSSVARDGGLDTAVVFVDHYGNCVLAGTVAELYAASPAAGRGGPAPITQVTITTPSGTLTLPWASTFGEVAVGAPLLYQDGDYAQLAIAVHLGSAAEQLGLGLDDPIRLVPA